MGKRCQGGCRGVGPREDGAMSWMNLEKGGGARELVWEIRSWAGVCVHVYVRARVRARVQD